MLDFSTGIIASEVSHVQECPDRFAVNGRVFNTGTSGIQTHVWADAHG